MGNFFGNKRESVNMEAGNSVLEWLQSIEMGEYWALFEKEGYDSLPILRATVTDEQALERLGITKKGHRRFLLMKLQGSHYPTTNSTAQKKTKRKREEDTAVPGLDLVDPAEVEPKTKQIRTSNTDSMLSFDTMIGLGIHSTVYIGRWNNQPVTIKQYNLWQHPEELNRTQRDVEILLSSPPHPNYLTPLHIIRRSDHINFVFESCPHGTLADLLRSTSLSFREFLRLSHHIALGMSYLHSKGIVHSDLSCRNIFLFAGATENEWIPKIGNLGIGQSMGGGIMGILQNQSLGRLLSVKWASPEILQGKHEKGGDVWSFANVLVEMMTGKDPFPSIPNDQVSLQSLRDEIATRYLCPTYPTGFSDDESLRQTIQSCWLKDLNQRPSFDFLAHFFQSLISPPLLLQSESTPMDLAPEEEEEEEEEGAEQPDQATQQPNGMPSKNENSTAISKRELQKQCDELMNVLTSGEDDDVLGAIAQFVRLYEQHFLSAEARDRRGGASHSGSNDSKSERMEAFWRNPYLCEVMVSRLEESLFHRDCFVALLGGLGVLTECDVNRATIGEKGGVPAILSGMKRYAVDAIVQAQSCRLMMYLSHLSENNGRQIVDKNGVDLILSALKSHPSHEEVQWSGCGVLRNLACHHPSYTDRIGNAGGIELILSALSAHPDHFAVQHQATVALFALTQHSHQCNMQKVSTNGGVEKMISALTFPHPALQSSACRVLWNLSPIRSHRKKIVSLSGVESILHLMQCNPTQWSIQESACGVLMNLACEASYRELIHKLNGIQCILSALRAFPSQSQVQLAGWGALRNLSHSESPAKAIVEQRGTELALKTLQRNSQSADLQVDGWATLRNLARNEGGINKMVVKMGGIELILNMLTQHAAVEEVQKEGMRALWSLASHESSRAKMRRVIPRKLVEDAVERWGTKSGDVQRYGEKVLEVLKVVSMEREASAKERKELQQINGAPVEEREEQKEEGKEKKEERRRRRKRERKNEEGKEEKEEEKKEAKEEGEEEEEVKDSSQGDDDEVQVLHEVIMVSDNDNSEDTSSAEEDEEEGEEEAAEKEEEEFKEGSESQKTCKKRTNWELTSSEEDAQQGSSDRVDYPPVSPPNSEASPFVEVIDDDTNDLSVVESPGHPSTPNPPETLAISRGCCEFYNLPTFITSDHKDFEMIRNLIFRYGTPKAFEQITKSLLYLSHSLGHYFPTPSKDDASSHILLISELETLCFADSNVTFPQNLPHFLGAFFLPRKTEPKVGESQTFPPVLFELPRTEASWDDAHREKLSALRERLHKIKGIKSAVRVGNDRYHAFKTLEHAYKVLLGVDVKVGSRTRRRYQISWTYESSRLWLGALLYRAGKLENVPRLTDYLNKWVKESEANCNKARKKLSF